MARKTNAKRKDEATVEDSGLNTVQLAAVQSGSERYHGKKNMIPSIYTDIIQSLMEKNRKRVLSYYCPNMSCRKTFWDSEIGYTCPDCGSMGMISEYRHQLATDSTKDRNIIGYVDTLGRLVCGSCIMKYGIANEIGLVVFDSTEPFCNETCDLCKEQLTSAG